jgi:hypothetical protein
MQNKYSGKRIKTVVEPPFDVLIGIEGFGESIVSD